jgi:hypothetical protein
MQSGTALVEICKSPELWGEEAKGAFGALQLVSRRLDLGIADEIEECGDGCNEREPRPHKSELRSLAGEERFQGPIAERVGLSHDVGNLLEALSLYAELLASPGVLYEDYREYAEDLRLLSQRSTAMTSRLMQCGEERYREINDSMTLLPDVMRGMRGLREERLVMTIFRYRSRHDGSATKLAGRVVVVRHRRARRRILRGSRAGDDVERCGERCKHSWRGSDGSGGVASD